MGLHANVSAMQRKIMSLSLSPTTYSFMVSTPMSLASEYRRQLSWRDWGTPLALCPIVPGQEVLDLGCGIGDITRELAKRGALVTGIDSNASLLSVARGNPSESQECEFFQQNIAALELKRDTYDGLWCSFAAAYFVPFEEIFKKWLPFLTDTAWVCLIEVDDLLGHEPLEPSTRQTIEAFYNDSLKAGRYDFRAGGKLESVLTDNGFDVVTRTLVDKELSFDGPADSRVVEAWSSRLDRMGGLKTFLGRGFPGFRSEFLNCLASPRHTSRCKVVMTIGTRG